MALIERQATSLLMADSERVRVLDKVVSVGIGVADAPIYENGNLDDSIRLNGERIAYAPTTFRRTE